MPSEDPASALRPGVNLYGYVFAEHGVGEASRLLVQCVRQAGFDYAVIPYEITGSRQQAAPVDLGTSHPVYDVNLIVVNADSLPEFVDSVGSQMLDGRYNIGVWAWEIEALPPKLAASSRFLDEIWAISRFTADAIAQSVECPVFALPLASVTRGGAGQPREALGLSDDFLFLFCFDFNSLFDRKNPLGLLEAYERAFPDPGSGTQLVIKTLNGQAFSDDLERLNAAALARRDVLVVDGYLPVEEQNALMASCDAYVSLHRSEGFGLTLLEAMALGKPAIATGYSGNLDFMTPENSYLVPYGMVDVPAGCGPYPATSRWADPDLTAAAQLMRQVFEDREEARRKGERARRDVESLHSAEARSKMIAERLQAVRSKLDREPRRGGAGRHATVPVPRPRSEATPAAKAAQPHASFACVKDMVEARLVPFEPSLVAPDLTCGQLDGGMIEQAGGASVWGWAFDPRSCTPAPSVVLLLNDEQIAIHVPVGSLRPDVGAFLENPALAATGWSLYVPPRLLARRRNVFRAYAVLSDGRFGSLDTGHGPDIVLRRRSSRLLTALRRKLW